jgi:hypothetical protein
VRTTITLDENVAAKLRSLSRRSGRTFREVIHDVLRLGSPTRRNRASGRRFASSRATLAPAAPA